MFTTFPAMNALVPLILRLDPGAIFIYPKRVSRSFASRTRLRAPGSVINWARRAVTSGRRGYASSMPSSGRDKGGPINARVVNRPSQYQTRMPTPSRRRRLPYNAGGRQAAQLALAWGEFVGVSLLVLGVLTLPSPWVGGGGGSGVHHPVRGHRHCSLTAVSSSPCGAGAPDYNMPAGHCAALILMGAALVRYGLDPSQAAASKSSRRWHPRPFVALTGSLVGGPPPLGRTRRGEGPAVLSPSRLFSGRRPGARYNTAPRSGGRWPCCPRPWLLPLSHAPIFQTMRCLLTLLSVILDRLHPPPLPRGVAALGQTASPCRLLMARPRMVVRASTITTR